MQPQRLSSAPPVLVQSSGTITLETDHELYEPARDFISQFAELESSPDRLHTYRISRLSLWNAARAGLNSEHIISNLNRYSKVAVPNTVTEQIENLLGRYGQVQLVAHPDNQSRLLLVFASGYIQRLFTTDQGS